MSIISANLYKALKEAGVREELAEKASLEVAEATKTVLEQNNAIIEVKTDIKELKAKVNILITLNVAVLSAFFATMMGILFTLFIK
ncbi:hypothetical protein ABSA28_00548 [Candidatus Hepatincolaceae symbiont of Richtersius coronifer]